jgi:hypothetical protein
MLTSADCRYVKYARCNLNITHHQHNLSINTEFNFLPFRIVDVCFLGSLLVIVNMKAEHKLYVATILFYILNKYPNRAAYFWTYVNTVF